MYQDLNTGEFTQCDQETLDCACVLVSRYKDDSEMFPAIVHSLRVAGMDVCRLSNGVVVVYLAGDERATTILNANIAQLPEFLTHGEHAIRLLARHRLDELNK